MMLRTRELSLTPATESRPSHRLDPSTFAPAEQEATEMDVPSSRPGKRAQNVHLHRVTYVQDIQRGRERSMPYGKVSL